MKFDTIVSTRVELSKVSLLMDIPYIYIPKACKQAPKATTAWNCGIHSFTMN